MDIMIDSSLAEDTRRRLAEFDSRITELQDLRQRIADAAARKETCDAQRDYAGAAAAEREEQALQREFGDGGALGRLTAERQICVDNFVAHGPDEYRIRVLRRVAHDMRNITFAYSKAVQQARASASDAAREAKTDKRRIRDATELAEQAQFLGDVFGLLSAPLRDAEAELGDIRTRRLAELATNE